MLLLAIIMELLKFMYLQVIPNTPVLPILRLWAMGIKVFTNRWTEGLTGHKLHFHLIRDGNPVYTY